jgi:hypothetical protein
LFTIDCDLESILREQNYLAKHGHIPISDSEYMVDFERVMHVGMIAEALKKEAEIRGE